MRTLRIFLALTALASLSGCGLHTTKMRMNPPDAPLPGAGHDVVIAEVVDHRVLATLPESTRTRLDAPTQTQLGASGRASAIAGNGSFIWLLQDDGSVEDWVRDLVTAGLRKQGFRVVPKASAAKGTPSVRIEVQEFWAYIPINFGRALTWTQQMKAWIQTRIDIQERSGTRTIEVSGYGAHIVQMFSEENVREAYGLAADDYLIQFGRKFPDRR